MVVTAGSAVSLMPGGNLSGGRFLDTDSTGMSVRSSIPTTTASTSISATARPYLRIFRSRSVEDEERGSSEEIIGAHPAEAAGSSAEGEQMIQQNLADIPGVGCGIQNNRYRTTVAEPRLFQFDLSGHTEPRPRILAPATIT